MSTQNTQALRELLGALIAKARKDLGMTRQEDLEAASGVSVRTISQVETGSRSVRISTLRKIERAIKWPPGSAERILKGEDPDAVLTPPTSTQASAEPEFGTYAWFLALRRRVGRQRFLEMVDEMTFIATLADTDRDKTDDTG